jgi:hypothetical protein
MFWTSIPISFSLYSFVGNFAPQTQTQEKRTSRQVDKRTNPKMGRCVVLLHTSYWMKEHISHDKNKNLNENNINQNLKQPHIPIENMGKVWKKMFCSNVYD